MLNYSEEKCHVAVIMAEGIYSELYPLSEGFPIANITVGNKKLIVYQLQQLQQIISISKIFIVYNQKNFKVKNFIEKQFHPNFPHYPHPIQFFKVKDGQSEYLSLKDLLISQCYQTQTKHQYFKGAILMPVDTISSYRVKDILDLHTSRKADLTLFLKQKKQYLDGAKKPEVDYENQYDIGMIGSKDQVLALNMAEEYQNNFKLHASIYRRASRATFQKLIDSQIYVFGPSTRTSCLNSVEIVRNLISEDIYRIKPDFIHCLVRNQTNTTLLREVHENYSSPLKICCKVVGPDEYVRRISETKVYKQVNFDSLIRGQKEKPILLPTQMTQKISQEYSKQYKNTLIGDQCLIDPSTKIRRSCIENGCKIGKNVEIMNSVILANTVIEEGCKIIESVIGPSSIIRQDCSLLECSTAANCHIEGNRKFEQEEFIPND